MTARAVGLSLPGELLKIIDEQRGDISRSRFLLRIIQKNYKPKRAGLEKKKKARARTNGEKGSAPFSPLKAARFAREGQAAREYLSASVNEEEEVDGEEYLAPLSPLKAAALAKEKQQYKSAARAAKCPCPACSR